MLNGIGEVNLASDSDSPSESAPESRRSTATGVTLLEATNRDSSLTIVQDLIVHNDRAN